MGESKKVIGSLLAASLTLSVFVVANNQEFAPEIGEPEVTETIQTIQTEPKESVETVYLTDKDFEKLYTLRSDVRKEDSSIISLTIDDAILMMKVGREEGGTSLLGQFWVMRTIYNRLLAGWGNSIWEILNQDNQFAVVTNGSYLNADINAETHLALAMLESGYDPTEGALYWESNTNSPNSWHKRNLEFIAEVDGNLFYRERSK